MAWGRKGDSENPLLPLRGNLEDLRNAAKNCEACDLYKRATQTVFGEGGPKAKIMMIGEQPGNQEDREGKPFVGPAGKLLDIALEDAGIDRTKVYVTNAVKHFTWEPRGKRRIHKKPSLTEISACRPWFEAEIAAVRPKVIVCLGATAAQSLLGRDFRVTERRGELIESKLAPYVTATVHPSSILRAPDEEARHEARKLFLADLKKIARLL
jgi:uracil-DNA glycosylase